MCIHSTFGNPWSGLGSSITSFARENVPAGDAINGICSLPKSPGSVYMCLEDGERGVWGSFLDFGTTQSPKLISITRWISIFVPRVLVVV